MVGLSVQTLNFYFGFHQSYALDSVGPEAFMLLARS